VFTAGPAPTGHLDAEVVHASASLAERAVLREELAHVDAEVYLVEIKAAGIDVVADTARSRGAEVVFADNEPVPLPGEPDLETALRSLVQSALKEPAVV
jgi:cyclic 2,3-diphosphoglycerate synthetase